MKKIILATYFITACLISNASAEKIPDKPYTPGCYVHVDCGQENKYRFMTQKVVSIIGGSYIGHDSMDRYYTLITYKMDGETYRQEFEGIPNQWRLGKALLILVNGSPTIILNNGKDGWGAD